MRHPRSRRQFLTSLGGAAASLAAPAGAAAPTAPVAVAKCPDYGPNLVQALERMFDQLGGVGRLVKGKTVAIKLNLTGRPSYRLGYTPLEDAQWTHHRVIGATVHLLGKAGARRIRLLESPWSSADPVEEYILAANWDPQSLLTAAPNVEFENTNYLGRGKKYSRLRVPSGCYMFRAFDLNHSYEDCDVFVSLAKLKEHATAGVTLSMKNCFGITPCTIYGTGAGTEIGLPTVSRMSRRIWTAGNPAIACFVSIRMPRLLPTHRRCSKRDLCEKRSLMSGASLPARPTARPATGSGATARRNCIRPRR